MRESSRTLVVNMAVGVIAGLVATKVTDWAQAALYGVTPAKVREKEERVRPGPPAEIAAEDLANRLGVQLDEKARARAGNAVHYTLGRPLGTHLRATSAQHPHRRFRCRVRQWRDHVADDQRRPDACAGLQRAQP